MRSMILAVLAICLFPQLAFADILHDAVKLGDIAAVSSALDKGADINEIDGVTALYIACNDGNFEVASLLVKRGADVNLPARWGTPLYAATKGGHADIMKLLLDNGANANQPSKSMMSLHVAAEIGCLKCVSLLVEAGGDVNALTSERRSPLSFAKLNGHKDVIGYLREHGAGPPSIAPISARLASASVDSGKEIFGKTCGACHLAAMGVKNRSHLNLWGVVGRPKAAEVDWQYSEAMSELGGAWTYEELNAFIAAPALTLPGTAMAFNGLPDETQRVDVVAYLRTLSDTPPPLPGN